MLRGPEEMREVCFPSVVMDPALERNTCLREVSEDVEGQGLVEIREGGPREGRGLLREKYDDKKIRLTTDARRSNMWFKTPQGVRLLS